MLKFNGWDDVEVGTVGSFQGREKRVMLVSTVRSQCDHLEFDNTYSLGFLTQPEVKFLLYPLIVVERTCDYCFW